MKNAALILAIAILAAGIVLACQPAKETTVEKLVAADDTTGDDSANDDTASDDASDDTADDAGDDEAPTCAEVWSECEYANQIDTWLVDECGEEPVDFPLCPEAYDWVVCGLNVNLATYQALSACGRAGGCEDWKAALYDCLAALQEGYIGCAQAAEIGGALDWNGYMGCRQDLDDSSQCGDV